MTTFRNVPETDGPKRLETSPKRSKLIWIRFLGIGCLTIILCFGIGFSALYFSGVLSGPGGDLDATPAWSPDGSRIAFMSNRDGYSDIYVMNADGSHVVQLTRDPFAYIYFFRSPTDSTPAWSPDGKQIAFASGRENGMMSYIDTDIYLMSSDGSNIVRLTNSTNVEQSPVWSPDGERIAFTVIAMFSEVGPIQNPTLDIHIMDTDGLNEIQLTNDPANKYGIVWSPDGNRILFVSESKGSADLYLMQSNGSDVVQLTADPANEGAPTWSPDGLQIAFVSDRGGNTSIFVMNADGSNVVQLTNSQSNSYSPSWSPDGSKIAFSSDLDGDDDIYIMNADGTNIVQLTGR